MHSRGIYTTFKLYGLDLPREQVGNGFSFCFQLDYRCNKLEVGHEHTTHPERCSYSKYRCKK